MKRFQIVGMTVFAAVAMVPFLGGQEEPQKNDNNRKKIRALREQRCEIFKERLEIAEKLFEQGAASSQKLGNARMEYAYARLELAETREQRIKILLENFRQLQKLEASVFDLHEAGVVSVNELKMVTADRLKAEIELLEARES